MSMSSENKSESSKIGRFVRNELNENLDQGTKSCSTMTHKWGWDEEQCWTIFTNQKLRL